MIAQLGPTRVTIGALIRRIEAEACTTSGATIGAPILIRSFATSCEDAASAEPGGRSGSGNAPHRRH